MQTLESKKIEDYLHLYLGCDAMYGGYRDPEKLVKIIGYSLKDGVQFQFAHNGEVDTDPAAEWFKPILRPLSDMTEEEKKELLLNGGYEGLFAGSGGYRPEAFRYLLSKHFDLFGLIPAGLAIEKLKNNKDANT